MSQIEIADKENNSFISNQKLKNHNNKENEFEINFQNLFSHLKFSKTINNKKNIIDNLITIIKKNKEYLNIKETKQILIYIYKFLQTSILDNNILFILSQISLIEILMDYLYNDKTFILFFKRILPKLLDKLYLHDDNINKSLLSIFEKSIKNILPINDYYVYIENISLEDDNNYILNVLKFFYSFIKNENISYDSIPINVINIIKQKYEEEKNNNLESNDNKEIKELCKKILSSLNESKNQKIEDKLSYMSFIKKIVKVMKEKDSSSSFKENESFFSEKENNNKISNNNINRKNNIF